MQLLSNNSAASTLPLLLLLSSPPSAHADIYHDVGVVPEDGASIYDCIWSLQNESRLGARAILDFTVISTHDVCGNGAAERCDGTLAGWKFFECVARVGVRYADEGAPPLEKPWINSHGSCYFDQWGKAIGNFPNNYDICFCSYVWKSFDYC
jgi:hypothetical protein